MVAARRRRRAAISPRNWRRRGASRLERGSSSRNMRGCRARARPKGDALAFAARERRGFFFQQRGQAEHVGRGAATLGDLVAGRGGGASGRRRGSGRRSSERSRAWFWKTRATSRSPGGTPASGWPSSEMLPRHRGSPSRRSSAGWWSCRSRRSDDDQEFAVRRGQVETADGPDHFAAGAGETF